MTNSEGRSAEPPWDAVEHLLALLRRIAPRLAVHVVTNTSADDIVEDFSRHSLATEYFSLSEVEEMVGAIRSFGIHTRLFFSEDDFLRAVLAGTHLVPDREFLLVHAVTRGGHGPGRKALVPAFCQLHRLPLTGCDPYSVGLARHKFHTNRLLAGCNISVPDSWWYSSDSGWITGAVPDTGSATIVKPTYEGASVGIDAGAVAPATTTLTALVHRAALEYKQPMTTQAFIHGWEVEVPVMGLPQPVPFGPIGISVGEREFLGDSYLTYDLVKDDQYAFYPFQGPGRQVALETAAKTFLTLGLRGFARVDFRIDRGGQPYVMDVSTTPHLIGHSSTAYAFRAAGYNYEDVIGSLIGLAFRRAYPTATYESEKN